MSLDQLLPSVQALRHEEKIQLMEWLADQLKREQPLDGMADGTEVPIWSPYDAAATLHAFLEKEKAVQK